LTAPAAGHTWGMANYTMVNMKEVEDQAPKFGMAPNIEARYARRPLELEKSGVSHFRLAPNFRQPFGHKHAEQEEIYVLVDGSARVKVEDEIVDLAPWDALRVGPGVMRQFEAGPDGAEFLAFGAPATGEMDAQMLPGWWSGD
jgi:mannose-6-phosphate isomerase-like protein (cupin superfamily)